MSASDFFKGLNPVKLIKDEEYLYQQILNFFEHDPESKKILEEQLEKARPDPAFKRIGEDKVRLSLMMGIGTAMLTNNAPCIFSQFAVDHIGRIGEKILKQKMDEIKELYDE